MIRSIFKTLLVAALALPGLCIAQSGEAHDLRREGDRKYDKKEFLEAEEAYRKSSLLEPTPQGSFNLGNSIFKQRRYEDASKQFERAQELAPNDRLKADSWYNLGNAKYLNGEVKPSVQAYKEALKLNPQDLQAKQNLLMALHEVQQQQQQQQQQQDQQEQEEQDDDQEQQQQQQQDQQQQQQSQGEDDDNPQEEQQQEQQEQQLSKEQAMQLLKIIEEEDQKVQEKMRQGKPQKKKEKDW